MTIDINGDVIDEITIDGEFTEEVTVDGEIVFQRSAIPDSAILRFTLDDADTSGSTVTDVWNNNDGTINGSVTTGVSGANQTYTTNEAYDFGGRNNGAYVSFSSLGKSGNFSVAFWMYPRSNGGYFLTNYENGVLADDGEVRVYLSTDVLAFSFYDGDWVTTAGPVVSLNTWTHYIIVWDEDGQEVRIYQDGTRVTTESKTATMASAGRPWGLGAERDGGGGFDGISDDLRLYSKALSDTEASDLYNNGSI